MSTWWRRNRWGVAALVPVLAATVALNWGDAYDKYWKSQPREAVTASDDGWVSFAGARMRLAGLGPGNDLTVFGGKPFPAPSGTTVWKARIAFAGAQPDDLAGCAILLEDAAGRTYEASPAELSEARGAGFVSCTPSIEDEDRTEYERAAYFITPAGTRPSAVRITLRTQTPRFARLTL